MTHINNWIFYVTIIYYDVIITSPLRDAEKDTFRPKTTCNSIKGTWRYIKTNEVISDLGLMIWKSRNPIPISTDHTLFWNLELTELENIICCWFLSMWWRYVAISSFTRKKFKPLESATTWSPRLYLYIFGISIMMAFKWAFTKTVFERPCLRIFDFREIARGA